MSGANQPITITVNDAEVRNALNALRGKMKDLRRPLREIGRVMQMSTEKRFVDSKDPDGNRWIPNPGWVAAIWGHDKKRSPGDKKPLIWHGHLSGTIHYQVSAFALLVGTNMEYGADMQFGVFKYWKRINRDINIPARPFLGVSKQDRVDILEILFDHLNKP